jgi:hypothetical protein
MWADDRGEMAADHIDEVGQVLGITAPKFDPLEFCRARELAAAAALAGPNDRKLAIVMLERRGRHAEADRHAREARPPRRGRTPARGRRRRPRSAGCRPRPRRRVVLGLDDLLTR